MSCSKIAENQRDMALKEEANKLKAQEAEERGKSSNGTDASPDA